jgi:Mrp family chromosome partitioning ATPase
MDCDFKNPSIHFFFDRPEIGDFHKFVSEGGDISDFIYLDQATGLYVADSANSCEGSSEKLSLYRFGEIVAALKKQFDFVIIDTPPCGIAVDAEIVVESSDAVLLVVRQDVVNVAEINSHIETLNKAYIAGCIFNNVYTVKKIKNDQSSQSSKYYYHGQA